MTLAQTTILGILQGLTEFLPVSSSGHLVIMQHYLRLRNPLLLFDIVLHAATVAAVFLYFRKDIFGIVLSLIRFAQREPGQVLQRKLFYLIILGTVPIALVGGLLRSRIENLFANVPLTSLLLLVTGTLLWTSERAASSDKEIEKVGILDAFLIGIMQAAAILPGISRSGATISAGLFRGTSKEFAFRYSFLLSIPAILGALFIEAKDAVLEKSLPHHPLPWLGGAAAAFLIGYFSLVVLKKALVGRRLYWFSYYCWIVGGISLLAAVLKGFPFF
jgi:undecaprenyl-diphosphatase